MKTLEQELKEMQTHHEDEIAKHIEEESKRIKEIENVVKKAYELVDYLNRISEENNVEELRKYIYN